MLRLIKPYLIGAHRFHFLYKEQHKRPLLVCLHNYPYDSLTNARRRKYRSNRNAMILSSRFNGNEWQQKKWIEMHMLAPFASLHLDAGVDDCTTVTLLLMVLAQTNIYPSCWLAPTPSTTQEPERLRSSLTESRR